MAGVEDFLLALLAQAGVGAVLIHFAQRLFQTGLLIAVAMGASLFDLLADGLLLGCATGQAWLLFGSQQGRGQE
ncbi:hypothetical protein D3C84_1119480 [compost metagenome]